MKIFKWKSFFITSLVCLLPILLGISLWDKLPEIMAIHFNIYGEADGFASRAFVVFGFPCLMVLLQAFCCFVNDINAYKKGERKKFSAVTKWIIPFMSIVLQMITIGIGLGWNIDVRRAVAFIVGVVLIIVGNYLPKFDEINGVEVGTEKARQINRFIGYETVVMGLLFIVSLVLPPVMTTVCLFLLIPYALIGVIFGIVTARK